LPITDPPLPGAGIFRLKPSAKTTGLLFIRSCFMRPDIIYDQKSKYGIMLRKTLEVTYSSYKGDTTKADWKNLLNIVEGYGSAMVTIIIMVMKNSYPLAPLNIFFLVKGSDTAYLPKEANETVQAFFNPYQTHFV
jgi:hypothetical protein